MSLIEGQVLKHGASMNQNVLLFSVIPHLRAISLFGDPQQNRMKEHGNAMHVTFINLSQGLLFAFQKLFLDGFLSCGPYG